MKNLDTLKASKAEAFAKINEAVKSGDAEVFAEAFEGWADTMQQAVLAEASGMISAQDSQILAGRGVRQLTSEEKTYYNKVIDAMKSKDPKQALTMVDDIFPKTVIDAVLEDVTEAHPLLGEINFQNTGILTSIIVSTLDGRHLATWGKLCDEVVKELLGGFDTIDLTQKKLSAFLPLCKAMLEIGPEWLDRYVRAILTEAIFNGMEKSVIDGNGIDEPCGMMRDPNSPLDPANGYGSLAETVVNAITPATYGAIVSGLATGPNGLGREVSEVLFIVNPVTYFTKVMPAVTFQNADGTYVQRFPFPTKVIQSVYVPANKAIVGIGRRYFFGLGTGSAGKIEFSDHYHFLEDERVYLTKLYGNGRPLDSTSFKVLNIAGLVPTIQTVNANVTNASLDVDIVDDPLNVTAIDARLASLKIGAKVLSPVFNKSIMYYTCATTDATNTITAVAMDGEATIEIDVDDTPVANGAAATWADGANTVTVVVESGSETETYTVLVTKS
jgi:HK97 family phage major capsid protein